MTIPPGFERVRSGRTELLVRSDARHWLAPLLLTATRGEQLGDAARALSGGRGGSMVVQVQTHEVVLRPYRRGGLPARLLRETYFGWNPRPVRELCTLERLRRGGVPVIEPLGAAVSWLAPGCYRGWIATRYEPSVQTLWEWASTAVPGADRTSVWRQVGVAVRRLHATGARHPDLNLHNVLLSDDSGAARVLFVDFDQPRFANLCVNTTADLRRLRRSARKLDPLGTYVTAADLEQLLAAYREATT